MAEAVNRAGVTTVRVDSGSGLATLGYATDQPEVRDVPYFIDVPGDQHGGPQGPPIDRQFLGRVMRIRIEMSKYDKNELANLRSRIKSVATEGTVADGNIGQLMITDAKTVRLLLSNANDPQNFPTCILEEPIEVGYGTKFSTLILEAVAHRNQTTGVLYNSVTT